MLNRVQLIGNVQSDSRIIELGNGHKVLNMVVVTVDKYISRGVEKETTDYHNVSVWNELAEAVENKIQRDVLVYIDGKCKYKTSDGKKFCEIQAKNIMVLNNESNN